MRRHREGVSRRWLARGIDRRFVGDGGLAPRQLRPLLDSSAASSAKRHHDSVPRLVPPVVPAGRISRNQQPVLDIPPDLTLRPWAPSDGPALVDAFSDVAIQQWHIRELTSAEEAGSWIAGWTDRWRAETDASWAVTSSATGQLLGYVALRGINLEFGFAEVAYWVVAASRGQGVATRAAGEITRWALDVVGLHRLEVRHALTNVPSCKVALKLGFALEGTMRSAVLHADGWHDEHLHARIRAHEVARPPRRDRRPARPASRD